MKKAVLLVLLGVLGMSQSAHAQRAFGMHGWGPRVGVSIDPDQIYGGVHFDLGDLAKRLVLMPNVELGSGDHLTVLTTMFEVDYRFREDWGSWSPYLGGGIGPVFSWFSADVPGFGTIKGNSTDLGLTIQGGIMRKLTSKPGSFLIEVKLGISDAPDIKFTVGWVFGKGSPPAKN